MPKTKEALANQIVEKLKKHGHQAYLAGGCVRDRVRGVEPKDYDIATSAHPDQIRPLFNKTIPVGVQFGVILVLEQDISFEVATFRTEGDYQDGRHPNKVAFATVEEDAKRRDFTVNGLYWDIANQKIIDLIGGQKDIQDRLIRTIGNPHDRFLEDHLRMLRAIRFAVQLDFEIVAETLESIRTHAALIQKVSHERIRDELVKLLCSPQPARGIRLLDETGLLIHILPEVVTMKGVEQPSEYHPEGDVFVHTLMLLDGLSNAPIELAMGALLHDVAKPVTFERAPDRIRFHGHDRIGAEMATSICKRLAFPNVQTEMIASLVNEHLRFKDAFQMRVSTLKRFFSLERFDWHLELHRLDCLASHKNLDAYRFCQEKLAEFAKEPPPPSRVITGQDLIELGFLPGPHFTAMLRSVEDAVLEGAIKNREEALSYVKMKFLKTGDVT